VFERYGEALKGFGEAEGQAIKEAGHGAEGEGEEVGHRDGMVVFE
jgi:hypothetical protein